MPPNRYAVYSPNEPGLPFLSVLITERGVVESRGFEKYDDAFQHSRQLKALIENIDQAVIERTKLINERPRLTLVA